MQAHKAQIDLSGPMPKVQDPAVLAELNKLLQALTAQVQKVQAAQTRLQAVMLGD